MGNQVQSRPLSRQNRSKRPRDGQENVARANPVPVCRSMHDRHWPGSAGKDDHIEYGLSHVKTSNYTRGAGDEISFPPQPSGDRGQCGHIRTERKIFS